MSPKTSYKTLVKILGVVNTEILGGRDPCNLCGVHAYDMGPMNADVVADASGMIP